MILESQSMREEVMELRVKAALASNRLVRLDSPMLRDRVAALRQQAAAVAAAGQGQGGAAGGGGGDGMEVGEGGGA